MHQVVSSLCSAILFICISTSSWAANMEPACILSRKNSKQSNQVATCKPASELTSKERRVLLDRCSYANTLLDEANRSFDAWLYSVTKAYGDAYKIHEKILKEDNDERKLQEDLLVTALVAATTFLPAGNIIGALVRNSSPSKSLAFTFLVDSVKDVAKLAMRIPAQKYLARAITDSSGSYHALPTNPLAWQTQTAFPVARELRILTSALRAYQQGILNATNDTDAGLDIIDIITNHLMIEGKSLLDLQPVNHELMLKQFGQEFCKQWLMQYGYGRSAGYYLAPSPSFYDDLLVPFEYASVAVGIHMRSHCSQLEVDVDHFASISKRRIEEKMDTYPLPPWSRDGR